MSCEGMIGGGRAVLFVIRGIHVGVTGAIEAKREQRFQRRTAGPPMFTVLRRDASVAGSHEWLRPGEAPKPPQAQPVDAKAPAQPVAEAQPTEAPPAVVPDVAPPEAQVLDADEAPVIDVAQMLKDARAERLRVHAVLPHQDVPKITQRHSPGLQERDGQPGADATEVYAQHTQNENDRLDGALSTPAPVPAGNSGADSGRNEDEDTVAPAVARTIDTTDTTDIVAEAEDDEFGHEFVERSTPLGKRRVRTTLDLPLSAMGDDIVSDAAWNAKYFRESSQATGNGVDQILAEQAHRINIDLHAAQSNAEGNGRTIEEELTDRLEFTQYDEERPQIRMSLNYYLRQKERLARRNERRAAASPAPADSAPRTDTPAQGIDEANLLRTDPPLVAYWESDDIVDVANRFATMLGKAAKFPRDDDIEERSKNVARITMTLFYARSLATESGATVEQELQRLIDSSALEGSERSNLYPNYVEAMEYYRRQEARIAQLREQQQVVAAEEGGAGVVATAQALVPGEVTDLRAVVAEVGERRPDSAPAPTTEGELVTMPGYGQFRIISPGELEQILGEDPDNIKAGEGKRRKSPRQAFAETFSGSPTAPPNVLYDAHIMYMVLDDNETHSETDYRLVTGGDLKAMLRTAAEQYHLAQHHREAGEEAQALAIEEAVQAKLEAALPPKRSIMESRPLGKLVPARIPNRPPRVIPLSELAETRKTNPDEYQKLVADEEIAIMSVDMVGVVPLEAAVEAYSLARVPFDKYVHLRDTNHHRYKTEVQGKTLVLGDTVVPLATAVDAYERIHIRAAIDADESSQETIGQLVRLKDEDRDQYTARVTGKQVTIDGKKMDLATVIDTYGDTHDDGLAMTMSAQFDLARAMDEMQEDEGSSKLAVLRKKIRLAVTTDRAKEKDLKASIAAYEEQKKLDAYQTFSFTHGHTIIRDHGTISETSNLRDRSGLKDGEVGPLIRDDATILLYKAVRLVRAPQDGPIGADVPPEEIPYEVRPIPGHLPEKYSTTTTNVDPDAPVYLTDYTTAWRFARRYKRTRRDEETVIVAMEVPIAASEMVSIKNPYRGKETWFQTSTREAVPWKVVSWAA